MISKTVKADFLMLLTAAVWGFAFVAQRAGMEFVGPYTYNGVRFALGGLSLLPFLLRAKYKSSRDRSARQNGRSEGEGSTEPVHRRTVHILLAGVLGGTVLFLASSFQQVGLLYTTAGNAGFITGLYVILVPLTGLFFKQRPGIGVWIGAVLAVAGMYFLSGTQGLRISKGDFLVLICAFFFASHVLLIGKLSPKFPAIPLSMTQFFTCSLLSIGVALFREQILLQDILNAAVPILYGGVGSVGIAYTLQVIGQKDAPPGHAAIIFSLESVFAFFGGWLILSEPATFTTLLGCGLMLAGMIIAQIQRYWGKKSAEKKAALCNNL